MTATVEIRDCRWCSSSRHLIDGVVWCPHCDLGHDDRNCERCQVVKNRHDVIHDYHGPPVMRSVWAANKESL